MLTLDQIMLFTVPYDWAALLIRLACGIALLPYGLKKIRERKEVAPKFPAVLGLSSRTAFWCALLVETCSSICMIFGFFTRIAAVAGACNMAVATNVSRGQYFTSPAQSYLLMFLAIFIIGPGHFSLDTFIFSY